MILGAPITERAIATRWLSPPERTEPAGADHGHHAHGHALDLLFDFGKPDRRPYFFGGHFLVVTDQVVPEVLGMKSDRLRHRADFPSHLFQVQVPQIASVVVHGAGGWPVDSEREAEQGALARTGLARNRHEFAGTGVNRDIVQNQGTFGIVAKGNVVE